MSLPKPCPRSPQEGEFSFLGREEASRWPPLKRLCYSLFPGGGRTKPWGPPGSISWQKDKGTVDNKQPLLWVLQGRTAEAGYAGWFE